MPATVTTPVDVLGVTYLTPSTAIQPKLTSTGVRTAVAPAVALVNAAVTRHLVTPAPIKRWNGTAWVTLYVPRI